ncbi:MAG: M43 family zinc metalloprotease, partial [Planctomycetota bacterium]|nr:M43 family zinc metalloprotease [Planctomycetota bacterium]
NNAGGRGSLGYVPDLPQGGNLVGKKKDRVVVLWNSFGRNAPNKIFNMGKTSTHEVGHYFGLLEVWENKCGSASACYTTGDLICDTKPQQKAVEGCKINATSCGTPDPVHNYMSESDDACMWWFTSEQVRRMRCTIEHWRPKLATRYSLASVSLRNAGNNLKTYKATLPVLGSRFTAAVDLQSTGYRHAALFGYTAPAKLPTIRGYMVLIDLSAPPGNVLPLPFLPGPVARFSFPIPNLSALAGFKLYTQAAHFSGKADFSLSNAQDLIFGMK